jgi:hypothetical protein
LIQQRTFGQIITIASVAAIAMLTMTPSSSSQPAGARVCLVCGSYGGTDVLLNMLLFIPFGVGLRLAGVRSRHAILLAAATSLAIELLQIRVVVGRDASLGDLVSNSVGAWVGIELAAHWRAWVLPYARHARRRAHAGALLWLVVLAGSAWAARPSLSRTMYWGHWASTTGPGPLFDGQVIRASVGGVILPWNPIPDSRSMRRRLLRGHQPLEAVVRPGAPIDGLAQITRITDIRRRELIMLGQSGRDLVFRMRTHASDLRLRDPAVRIDNVFPDSATVATARQRRHDAEPVRIAGAFTGQAYRVWTTSGGGTTSREVRLGPGLGWSFLIPFSYAAGGVALLFSAVWLGALLLPVAYWSARSTADARPPSVKRESLANASASRTVTMLGMLVATIALGLGLVPLIFHEAPVHWSAWLGCGLGATAGWGLGRASLAAAGRAADDEIRTERRHERAMAD